MAPRILIAEDDFTVATNLFTWFERKGFDVETVYNGQAALHRCSVDRFDVILLDLGLPRLDGLAFLQRLRHELRVATPVLVISARSDLSDKLAGFEHGADDYVTKPFALAEIEARVRALLLRARGDPVVDPVRRLGPLAFDTAERTARVGDVPVRLTPKAAQLLELLLRRPGQLVRRQEIEHELWGSDVPQPDALRSQVPTRATAATPARSPARCAAAWAWRSPAGCAICRAGAWACARRRTAARAARLSRWSSCPRARPCWQAPTAIVINDFLTFATRPGHDAPPSVVP